MPKITSVFGHKEDLVLFVIPLVLGLTVKNFFTKEFILPLYLFKVFIQSGHLFMTAMPWKEKPETISIIHILLYLGIFILVDVVSPEIFFNVMSLASLYHILFQHLGWYKRSAMRGEDGKLFTWPVHLLIFVWLCNLFPSAPGYLFEFKLLTFVKDYYILSLPIRVLLAVTYTLLFSFLVFKKRGVVDRPFYFFGTLGWLLLGIVFENQNSNYFFGVYGVVAHGLSYTIFMMKGWPKEIKATVISRSRMLNVLLVGGSGGAFLLFYSSILKGSSSLASMAMIPLILHYAGDSLIWSSKNEAGAFSPAWIRNHLKGRKL